MKMLVVFQKQERLRFVGHLDLMRAMQRALRRSGVPITFSKGFNPHLLLTFAAPLSVGMIGEREIMDVPLADEISEAAFLDNLNKALPPELPCLSARAVDDRHPASMAQLTAASYTIELKENASPILDAIPAILSKSRIMMTKKTKSGDKPCDIRPMIHALTAEAPNTLCCTLALGEHATCKAELLLDALAKEAGLEARPHALYTRTRLLGQGLLPVEFL